MGPTILVLGDYVNWNLSNTECGRLTPALPSTYFVARERAPRRLFQNC